MRRLFACSLILVVSSCAPVTRATRSAGDAVVFTKKAPPTGDVITSSFRLDMQMKMEMVYHGTVVATVSQGSTGSTRYVLTELAGPDGATRLQRLHYLEKVDTDTENGVAKPHSANPVAGKTYQITTKGDDIEVADANGRPVSKAESKTVRADLGDVGVGDAFADWLVAHPLTPGKRIPVSDDVVKKLFSLGSKESTRLSNVVVTLQKVRNEPTRRVAVLEMSFEMDGGGGKEALAMKIPLHGTLEVELGTCRLAGVHISGPVHMTGSIEKNGEVVNLRANGTFAIDATTTPGSGKS